MHKFLTRHRLITAFIITLLGISTSPAQSLPEYQNGLFTLDIGVGANIDISSLDEAEKAVFPSRPSTVTQIGLRPAYYFSRHWGAYADIRINLFHLDNTEKLIDILVPGLGKIKPAISIGGTYRYEHSRWQIQPRLGIGLTSYGNRDKNMTCKNKHVRQKLRSDMLCVDAAISFAYRTSRVCSIFLDVNTMRQLTPAKFSSTTTIDGVSASTVAKSSTWGNTVTISAGVRLGLCN